MRGALPVGFFFLASLAGCWDNPQPAAPPSEPGAPPSATPAPPWLPPLTPAQEALRRPVQKKLQATASRVYPDLSRFGYAPPRPLANPEEALRYTRLVTQVLNDSPRYYTLGEAPAELANLAAQYGPPAEDPDAFKVAVRRNNAIELAPAPEAATARGLLLRGDRQAQGGDQAGALASYRAAAQQAPGVPAAKQAVANALRRAGQLREADAAYREAAAVDPTFAPAHLGVAELALERGDFATARGALAEALAYHPPTPRALEMARRLGAAGSASPQGGGWLDPPAPPPPPATSSGAGRAAPFAIFLDVDDVGAVHVGTARGDAAQIYGGCRAVVRHEPDMRAALFKTPREAPYFLGMGEEIVCYEAALGAYLTARGQGGANDADMEALFRVASEEGLAGYVLFEILGQHRPERARTAPPDVHRAVVAYIEKHVLGAGRAPSPLPAAPSGGPWADARW
jgi:tetratricopeptide (TPR) repeat protein